MTNKEKLTISLSSLSVFLFFVTMQLTTWIPLRFWKIWSGQNFFDLNLVLFWASCFNKYGNFIFEKPLDQTQCTGYIYGSSLIKTLAYFKLNSRDTLVIGYFFMFLLSLVISFVAMKAWGGGGGGLTRFPFLMIVLSPATLLLAELGNFDILVLFLVIAASLLLGRNLFFPALILIAVSSLMKFYTAPLLLLILFLAKSRYQRILTVITSTFVSYKIFADLKQIKSSFPSGFYEQFGASVWPRYLENSHFHGLGNVTNLIIGIVLFSLLYKWISVQMKRRKFLTENEPLGSMQQRSLFYLLFGTHLSCFIMGMNLDHRLIFFTLSSLIYIKVFLDKESRSVNLVSSLVITALWLTFPAPGLEPFGDFALEVVTVFMSIKFFQLVKFDLTRSSSWLILPSRLPEVTIKPARNQKN